MVVFFASKPTKIGRVSERYSFAGESDGSSFAMGSFRDPTARTQVWRLEWSDVNSATLRATRWQYYQLGGRCSGWFLWLPPKEAVPMQARFFSKISYTRKSEHSYDIALELLVRKDAATPAAALGPVIGAGLIGGVLIAQKAGA